MTSEGLGSNVFLAILVGVDGAMGRNTESSLAKCAMSAANSRICNAASRPRLPAFAIAASPRKRPGRWRRKPETFQISLETTGTDRDAEDFPDRLSTRMAVASSSRGRVPSTDSAIRFTAQAQRNRTLHIREQAETGARATFSATPSRSRGKGSALRLGDRSGSCAWERASRPMCDGHSRKSFSSRALRKAATRPVARSYPSVMRGLSPTRSASNGCTRRFSPSAPKNKAKKSFS